MSALGGSVGGSRAGDEQDRCGEGQVLDGTVAPEAVEARGRRARSEDEATPAAAPPQPEDNPQPEW